MTARVGLLALVAAVVALGWAAGRSGRGSRVGSAILARFETPVPPAPRGWRRDHNLRMAAGALDGRVLVPGESLSFNAAVGEPTALRGFLKAPVIDGGVMVDDMAGGICQVASTLHAAAFFAGIDIPVRYPHTRPRRYVEVGLDATVTSPRLDLVLRNDLPFPIALSVRAEPDRVRAQIRGVRRLREVEMVRHVVVEEPFPTRVSEDPWLLVGTRVVRQSGIPGLLVRRERILREGARSWREERADRYPALPEIVRVGVRRVARGAASRPADDPPWSIAPELRLAPER